MADALYTYSVQDDFPNHKVDLSRLQQEIRDSAIVVALRDILVEGDDCNIWFKDALSSGDETILDGIVAVHSGEPLAPKLPVQPVKDIDVEGLDSDYARTMVKGINFDVAAGVWAKKTASWPYGVDLLNGEGYAGFADDGDKAAFRVAPTLIGVAVAPADQGATQIVIDDGIKGLFADKTVFPGMFVKFERGGDPQNPQGPDNPDPESDEYEIESFDADTNTITVAPGLETGISVMDLVYLAIYYGREIEIQQGEHVDVGGTAAGSAYVPANTSFEIWYYNTGAASKRVRLRLNCKYGPLMEE